MIIGSKSKMNTILTALILFGFCMNIIECKIHLDIIITIFEKFNIKHPIIQCKYSMRKNEKIDLFKILSYHGQVVQYNQKFSNNQNSPSVILADIHDFELDLHHHNIYPILVITSIQSQKDLDKIHLPINAEVYFMDWFSLKIYEVYTINKVHIVKYLGQFKDSGKNYTSFIENGVFVSSMVKRRGNLHGIQLKGMSEYSPPSSGCINVFTNIPKYFPNNETYDVTNLVCGVYIDVLHSLEKALNFTTILYKRKDSAWGYPVSLPNGTHKLNGMMLNVVEGSADFIWAPFSMVPMRFPFLDFMPPLSMDYGALLIPSNLDYDVEVDWTLYIQPFSIEVWLTLFVWALILAISIYIMNWLYLNEKLVIYT